MGVFFWWNGGCWGSAILGHAKIIQQPLGPPELALDVPRAGHSASPRASAIFLKSGEQCSKGLYNHIYNVFHYAHMVLSQILSRCFRDHTPGFRAMNIWQNCFRGAFAVFGKFIRSKQPVIHVYTYDMIYHYFKSLNHPLSRSFRDGVCGLRQAFAQLSRAGFLLSRALPSLSPSKALYNPLHKGFERCSGVLKVKTESHWKSLKVLLNDSGNWL